MSIKTTFFNTKLKVGPSVSHTYVVSIPGFKQLAFLVSSCPVPTPSRGSASVSFMGETYSLPTTVELTSGDWTVNLYENGLMEVLHAFYYAFTTNPTTLANSSKQDAGNFFGASTGAFAEDRVNYLDEVVVVGDFKGTSHIFNVDIYSFQGDYSFYIHTQLKNCWIKSFSAKGLDGSAVSDIGSCSMTLAYNGVELKETVANNPVANLIKYSALHLASKSESKKAGLIDTGTGLFGVDTGLAAKAKEIDLTTSEIVGGAKLLNFILGGGII